jgi:hypothetical protein
MSLNQLVCMDVTLSSIKFSILVKQWNSKIGDKSLSKKGWQIVFSFKGEGVYWKYIFVSCKITAENQKVIVRCCTINKVKICVKDNGGDWGEVKMVKRRKKWKITDREKKREIDWQT